MPAIIDQALVEEVARLAAFADAQVGDHVDGKAAAVWIDDGMPEQVMGTWEVMGNDLILTTAEGAAGSAFCIGGDRLDLWQPLITSTLTDVLCMDDQDCIDALGDMYEFYACTLP